MKRGKAEQARPRRRPSIRISARAGETRAAGGGAETREAILKAAEAEFAERGFGGARARAIAERAGVNFALPFYHFGSKQELYEAVLARMMGQLDELVKGTLVVSPRFEDWLETSVRRFSSYIAENPNWLRIATREMIDKDSRVADIARRYVRPLVDTVAARLRAYAESGEIRDIDPIQVIMSVTAEVVFYFLATPLLQALGVEEPLSEANLTARSQVVFAVLKSGLSIVKI